MTDFAPARFLDRHSQPHIVTLILLASIGAVTMNMFLPSLPAMATHFNTSTATMGLAVGVYLGASAVFQILSGPLSDMIGRRPIVLWSLAIFIAASVAINFAPNLTTFFILRALQAVAGTTMVLSRAIVRDTTSTEKAGSRIAYVTMGMSIVPMISPAIGGYIETHFGWQGNFWMLGLIGAMCFAIAFMDQGETAPSTSKNAWAQFQQYPALLTSQRFWGYCLASSLGSGAFFAYIGGAPFVGSVIYGLSPQQLGLYFGAPALGYFVGNFLSGRYSTRFGIDTMVTCGLLITLFGLSMSFAISAASLGSAKAFFGFMTLVGLGNGMTIPNATAGMLSIKPELAGTASGLGSAIMIGGGAALSAIAGLQLQGATSDLPLIELMLVSVFAGLLCILYVMHRNKVLKRH
ncbi:MAG: Bcr/CflA family efflux MFS transporter [Rhodobacteraceae bacterium]|jgi:DHA1 family bicyclomycin/chloramphenicol resistance-like MFS transporter|nr:Bcr/CflA family efflux MFS transporter [Paracoccaceae bacterium]